MLCKRAGSALRLSVTRSSSGAASPRSVVPSAARSCAPVSILYRGAAHRPYPPGGYAPFSRQRGRHGSRNRSTALKPASRRPSSGPSFQSGRRNGSKRFSSRSSLRITRHVSEFTGRMKSSDPICFRVCRQIENLADLRVETVAVGIGPSPCPSPRDPRIKSGEGEGT